MRRSRLARFLKGVGHDAGWAAMRLLASATALRGPGYGLALGRAIVDALWPLIRVRVRVSFRNAEVVLPDASPQERRRRVKEAAVETLSHWPEIVHYVRQGTGALPGRVEVAGFEHLERALAKGVGVVAPSVHLGNFSLIGPTLRGLGCDFAIMMRWPHDSRLARVFTRYAKALGMQGIRDIPRRRAVMSALRALKRNAVVLMQLDQTAAAEGVETEFFGLPYKAFTGPVSIALKTGSPVVPMYIVRTSGPRHRLVIAPEFELERTGDRRADVHANLRRLLRLLEGYIRGNPSQWWWFSRRWGR